MPRWRSVPRSLQPARSDPLGCHTGVRRPGDPASTIRHWIFRKPPRPRATAAGAAAGATTGSAASAAAATAFVAGASAALPLGAVAGALFLAAVAVTPCLFTHHAHLSQATSRALGGTSVLIVVGVALDTVRQMESQMTFRRHEGFLKR